MKPFLLFCLSLSGLLLATAGSAETLTADAARRALPAFELTDIDGNMHRRDDYRDNILVVNFWATWCPPCIKEMPALDRAAQALADDGVVVLGINMGESADDIAQFTKLTPVGFPLLLDENMEQGPQWELKGLPTTYIAAPDGTIRYTVIGEREWDSPEILDAIRALAQP